MYPHSIVVFVRGFVCPPTAAQTVTPLVANTAAAAAVLMPGWLSNVIVQVGTGGIHGSPSNKRMRASMAGTPFLRVVDR